jgi:phosphohistidine phosphatase
MELILWRHAEAEDTKPGGADDARRLTEKGAKQARRMGRWLRKRLPEDALILASPAERAQQTARALSKRFKTSRAVGTGSGPESLLKAAGWPDGEGVVVIVGHQPSLGEAVALALTGRRGTVRVKVGSLWWLEGGRHGEVVVRAAMAPDLV